MKILMIDDSEERIELVRSAINVVGDVDFHSCESADLARKCLGGNFDLLILDILIPKKKGQTPIAKHSINLLNDICDPSKGIYLRPNLIIGLTADIDYIEKYSTDFRKNASVVLEATRDSTDWLQDIIHQINSVKATKVKMQGDKRKLIISLHGIRTYGHWQNQITETINNSSYEFSVEELKFGFIDIVSFFIPKTRHSIIRKKALQLSEIVQRNNGKEINIISHSFGTCVVFHYFNNFPDSNANYNFTILSGSPLPCETEISCIVDKSRVTLNECGTNDLVLVFSKIFVVGLGDAGRIGFNRAINNRFKNRFFNGGHSLYFQKNADDFFYETYWLNLIKNDAEVKVIDERKNYFLEDVIEVLMNLIERFKMHIYILFVAIIIAYPLGVFHIFQLASE